MADPLVIVTAEQLAAYPGSGSATVEDAGYYVDLVNGLVTEAWANPVDPIPYWVTAIALEAGARVLRNPDGVTSFTITADDGSETRRYADTAARLGVYLTDSDLARLGGRRRRKQKYGTIRTTPGY